MNILIVGAGKVGSTLAAYLSREDHNVTIIDQNDTAIHRASDTLDVMCIKGPGAAPSVLREAGVEDADLVLATTNLDEVNMLWRPHRQASGRQVYHCPHSGPGLYRRLARSAEGPEYRCGHQP